MDAGRLSGLERVVGFAVVGDVADAVHGVFEEGRDGEDREANGRAGKRADEEEREAGGFAEEAEDAEGFGGHMPLSRCQPFDRLRAGPSALGARSKALAAPTRKRVWSSDLGVGRGCGGRGRAGSRGRRGGR